MEDPQYAGSTPGARFEVVQGVPAGSGAEHAASLPYPALALARVTLPASTATVQAAHITDLRALARPRQDFERQQEQVSPINQNLTSSTYVKYPNSAPYFRVPEWASRALVSFEVLGLAVVTGPIEGWCRVGFGALGAAPSIYRGERFFDFDNPTGGVSRVDLKVRATIDIPAADRGQMRVLRMECRRTGGTGSFRTHNGTQAGIDIVFQERAI